MDLDRLSALIGSIYAASVDADQWSAVMAAVARECGGESAALVVNDLHVNHSSVTAPDADPEVIACYTNRWWQHDPTAAVAMTTAVGQVTTLEYTGVDVYRRSAFHNDFWRYSGLGSARVAANLAISQGAFASCVVHASASNDQVGSDSATTFGLLVPHLIRAVDIQRRLWRLEIERQTLASTHGRAGGAYATVDPETNLIFCDELAEALFTEAGPPLLYNGAIGLDTADNTRRLRGMVASCLSPRPGALMGGTLTVPRPNGKPPLTIEVIPFFDNAEPIARYDAARRRPTAVLIFTDPLTAQRRRRDQLQQRFRLTPAEAAFAIEILKGDGREAAASRLGISLSTARTHLSHIYEKTGVNRQAELVRILMQMGMDAT